MEVNPPRKKIRNSNLTDEVKITEVNDINFFDIGQKLKEKEIHLICIASCGLNVLSMMAKDECNIPSEVVEKSVDLINLEQKVGTLYPQANISIIPILSWKTSPPPSQICSTSGIQEDTEIILNFIKDIFSINEKYIKSKIIHFSLEPSYINTEITLDVLKKYAKTLDTKTLIVQEVLFHLYN